MPIADVSHKSIAEVISLAGRRAVITGGARGIGKAIGRRLAEAGASVLLADIDEANAAAAARDLSEGGKKKVISTFVDVADRKSITAAADLAVEQLGGIDIWVNNAAIFPTSPVLEMQDEEWDKVLAVDLRGVFIGAREAARRMVAAGHGGVIVNVSSTAAFKVSGPGLIHYVAAKHGVRGVTRQLALELGSRGIRVLAVAPTLTATEGVFEATHGVIGGPEDRVPDADSPATAHLASEIADKLLLGRIGVPDDVARAVLFCASDMAIYMTGSTLLVDAGEVM